MSTSQRFPETMKSGRSAQSAVEFMIMITMALLVFTTFFTIFSERKVQAFEKQTRLRAKAVADRVSYELDLSLVQGSGFEKTFRLPQTIAGQNYSIVTNETDYGTKIFLEWEKTFVSSRSAAPEVEGRLEPGENHIKNNRSVLYVR